MISAEKADASGEQKKKRPYVEPKVERQTDVPAGPSSGFEDGFGSVDGS